jgi:hypothetical protein
VVAAKPASDLHQAGAAYLFQAKEHSNLARYDVTLVSILTDKVSTGKTILTGYNVLHHSMRKHPRHRRFIAIQPLIDWVR